MAFDQFLKQLFKKISTNKAISGYSIGPLEKVIDIVFRPGPDNSHIRFLPAFLKEVNHTYIIEYKSHRDVFTEQEISKTAMYKWGYCHNEKTALDRVKFVKGCLLSVRMRPWIHHYIQTGEIQATTTPGVYSFQNDIIDYLIVINELTLSEENLGLLLNASGSKLTQVLRFVQTHGYLHDPELKNYIYSKCFLVDREEEDEDLMTEVENVLHSKYADSIRNAVEIIGLEKLINSVGVEKVIEAVGVEKVIDYLLKISGPGEIQQLLKQRAKNSK